jgi:hypothetical protein
VYNGGVVLLNLSSHDEVLPDDDPWVVATRYGALSMVDGIPMLFYGQEKGIKNYQTEGSYWYWDGFKTDHEENFGKYVPHFKKWNMLTVWTNPPPDAGGLDQWYGRVNWARLNSPALRSQNRYFLFPTNGVENARILAAAKYETPYASPEASDVVLAFALLLRHGEAHTAAADIYDLKPAWTLLGLDVDRQYRIRNLASSDAFGYITNGWPRTGVDMYNNGIYVSLGGGTGGGASITDDGELVQYLKIEEEPDYDNDGLPLDFELLYGLDPTDDGSGDIDNGPDGDPDEDTMSNYAEFLAGTDPTSASSALRITGVQPLVAATNHHVSFTTEPGKRYAIQFRDGGLGGSGEWRSFANTNVGVGSWYETRGTSTNYTFIDDETDSTTSNAPPDGVRFYRIQLQ